LSCVGDMSSPLTSKVRFALSCNPTLGLVDDQRELGVGVGTTVVDVAAE
jgi:hypothetical protein